MINNMKNILYSAAFLLLLSACNVSKDIQTPKPALPDTFRNAAAATDSSSVGDMQWKTFFADATLQNLIDSAILRNYDMQIAVKNIEASQLLFKQVKWNNVPQVDLNVSANSSRPSDNSLDGLSLSQYDIATKHIET